MTYGPIDFLVLEFQTDNLKGEILRPCSTWLKTRPLK